MVDGPNRVDILLGHHDDADDWDLCPCLGLSIHRVGPHYAFVKAYGLGLGAYWFTGQGMGCRGSGFKNFVALHLAGDHKWNLHK